MTMPRERFDLLQSYERKLKDWASKPPNSADERFLSDLELHQILVDFMIAVDDLGDPEGASS